MSNKCWQHTALKTNAGSATSWDIIQEQVYLRSYYEVFVFFLYRLLTQSYTCILSHQQVAPASKRLTWPLCGILVSLKVRNLQLFSQKPPGEKSKALHCRAFLWKQHPLGLLFYPSSQSVSNNALFHRPHWISRQQGQWQRNQTRQLTRREGPASGLSHQDESSVLSSTGIFYL